MSTNTPNRGYTYPESGDDVQLWSWFQELATDVDTDVEDIADATIDKPYVRLVDSGTGQLLNHATASDVTWASAEEDTNGFWDAGTPTRITPDVPGLYTVVVTVWYPGRTGGYDTIAAGVRKNGSTLAPYVRSLCDNANADAVGVQCVVQGIELNGSTDYITGVCEQRNAGSAAVNLSVSGTFVSVMSCMYERSIPA